VKVYLDNSATSWPKPEEVYRAVDDFARNIGGNAGRSAHDDAIASGRVLLEARILIAQLIKAADPAEIVLAFNATDALNMAIKGVLEPGDHVVTTSMEHNAVLRPLNGVAARNRVTYTIVQSEPTGFIDPAKIAAAIRPETKLVIVNHVSNLIGTEAPLAQIGKITTDKGVLLLVDAAQSAGNTPIDVQAMGIDLLAFTGHKALLGFQGTGGLYIRPGVCLKPWREGGTGSQSELDVQPEMLPDALEAGTANCHGWAGVCAGVKHILEVGVETIQEQEWRLTKRLLEGLAEIPRVKLYGPDPSVQRGPIVSFNLEGMDGGEVGYELAESYGIMTRTGLHCTPHSHKTVGSFPEGSVRLSLSHFTTAEEISYTIESIRKLAAK